MGKAGKQLIEAAKEAVAVAKGEQPAARIHVAGHAYVPEDDVVAAIRRVRKHLNHDWISPGCREGVGVIGCISCQMAELDRALERLENEATDNEPPSWHFGVPQSP